MKTSSETLGSDQGVAQIDKQPGRHDGAENQFECHGSLRLEMVAGAHEQRAEHEKGDGRREEKDIEHARSPGNA
jgi:hypothetical protein